MPPARVVRFPDLSPKTRKQLLQGETGTQFDLGDRLFPSWQDGDVLDWGTWDARSMDQMLRRDGQAAALESVLTLPIRQATRAIEPGKDDNGEAEFVRSVLVEPATAGGMQTPLQDVIGQLTSAQIYRKAFYEKCFDVRQEDGRIVYTKLAFRPAATCELKRDERTAEMDGFRQQIWLWGGQDKVLRKSRVPGWVDIPKVRAFVYVHGKHREPLNGTSELDLCYWAYQTKMKLIFLWYQFLESQSLPKVIVYGESQEQANERADDVASMRASGIVGFETVQGEDKTFDILESSGKGATQFADALSFLETWQTSSVLAGFMGLSSLASLGRGSLALSQDQSAFFLKSRQAVTAEMETAITHDVIAPLVTLNFGPGASYPKFRFGALTDESGASLVQLFQTLAVAPQLQVPAGILDIITTRLASFLNLDVGAVDKLIQQGAAARAAQAQAGAPDGVPPDKAAAVGKLAGGVDAAHRIAQQALQRAVKQPLPEDMNQPFDVPDLGSGTQAG
jgi:hypothetical protein